ncbi:hypothetical protein GE09DRAFT_1292621 [Coniochaeta sp. 2T2.1]|nr:hypothetical protein GE09DRAFT_1292621 [Coniochaeta sp. 2T2.1]
MSRDSTSSATMQPGRKVIPRFVCMVCTCRLGEIAASCWGTILFPVEMTLWLMRKHRGCIEVAQDDVEPVQEAQMLDKRGILVLRLVLLRVASLGQRGTAAVAEIGSI